MGPAKHKFTILKQVVGHIPQNLVPTLARKHPVIPSTRYARRQVSFYCWSSVAIGFHAGIRN